MKKVLLKVLSCTLVMLMVIGVIPFTPVVSTAASSLPEKPYGYNRYYFYMPEEWKNEYATTAGIYWWEGTDACSSWPGYVAHETDVEDVYYYDVCQDVTTVIWNNAIDGGIDPYAPVYTAACQTKNIGTEYYDPDESPNYPDGTDNFDEMIYVIDQSKTESDNFSGKCTFSGEWFYYYGNGEYGYTPEKGNVYFNQQTYDEEPISVETAVITVDGMNYTAEVGDYISYYVDLKTPRNVEAIQAHIDYSGDMLSLVDRDTYEAFPNMWGVVANFNPYDVVYFNAVETDNGFDFTSGETLVELQFEVTSAGNGNINIVMEEMTEYPSDDYVSGGVLVDSNVSWTQHLSGAEAINPGNNEAVINCGGKVYTAEVGEVFTYAFELTTPKAVETIQAYVEYSGDAISLLDGDNYERFPNMIGVVSNFSDDIAYFNGSEISSGFDFTDGQILVKLQFLVENRGVAYIGTVIEEMVEFFGGDYITNSEVVADGVFWNEYITGLRDNLPDYDNAVIYCGNQAYEAEIGETITYVYKLRTPDWVENIQAALRYDSSVLELVEFNYPELFGVISNNTTDVLYFNASDIRYGFDFTDGQTLVLATFEVVAGGKTDVKLTIEEMVEFFGGDYVTGSEVVNSDVRWIEYIGDETDFDVPETGETVINCDGKFYDAKVGDIITYTFELTTPENIENVQAYVEYSGDILELVDQDEYTRYPNLWYVVSNSVDGKLLFNASDISSGFDFTYGGVLVQLQFEVVGTGEAAISTVIEEMVEFFGSDYVTDGVVVNDDVSWKEYIFNESEPDIPEYDDAIISCDGIDYYVQVGDVILYTFYLETPENIENVQGYVNYSSDMLTLLDQSTDVRFPNNMVNVVTSDSEGCYAFAASEITHGFDFTYGAPLVQLKFEVTDSGIGAIDAVIEEMVEFLGGDYVTGGEVIDDRLLFVESIEISDYTPEYGPAEIFCGNQTYTAEVGDVLTYVYKLRTPEIIENIQAALRYDSSVLELVEFDYPELYGVISNNATDALYFNASDIRYGFDFTDGQTLLLATFEVIAGGDTDVKLILEEMVEFLGGDYVTGGEVVNYDIGWIEYIGDENDFNFSTGDETVVHVSDTGYPYYVETGSIVTYCVNLTTPEFIESIDVFVDYYSDYLEVVDVNFPNITGALYDVGANTISLSANDYLCGYDFTEGQSLLEITFKTLKPGDAWVYAIMINITEFFGPDYVTDEELMDTRVSWTETLVIHDNYDDPEEDIATEDEVMTEPAVTDATSGVDESIPAEDEETTNAPTTDPTEAPKPTEPVATTAPATAVATEPTDDIPEIVVTTASGEDSDPTEPAETTAAPTEPANILTDEKTQISVEADVDAELKVVEIKSNKQIAEINYMLIGEKVGKLFDITLNKDGVTVQPDGNVKVRIPADNALSKVYRVEENGTLTDMAAVFADGFLEFVTEHFSLYVVAEPIEQDATETEPTTPATEDEPTEPSEPTKPSEPTEPDAADKGTLGDINGDGKINIKDATQIQKFAAKMVELTEAEQFVADVNSDGKVNVKDATAIQKYLAKIDTGLPIGKPA